ncbi:MAG: hypothetical protein HZA94_03625 [Candidatus Vogelbacteria bacterium]|nr:hypothetical protein [Candidatus Vogelbacteria bacterium]
MEEKTQKEETMHHFSHEMVHALSNRVFHINDPDQIGREFTNVRLSFQSRQKLANLNEAVTQMINLEILAYLRDERDGPDYLYNIDVPYFRSVVLLDEIIRVLAKNNNENPQTIRMNLYGSYFKGATVDLKIFEEGFGKGSLKLLAEMPDKIDLPYLEKIERHFKIDLKGLADKINSYIKKEEVEILGGIELRRTMQ